VEFGSFLLRNSSLGYHKNPTANAELFTADGWFRTGDLGQCDPAGNVRIVGRLKEMINRGGQKFFPREIEELLYTLLSGETGRVYAAKGMS
jgi:long-subunit acyl-CoA synthetase (AMP-forming)